MKIRSIAFPLACAGIITTSYGAVTLTNVPGTFTGTEQSSTSSTFASTPWAGQVSGTDLINATRSTLSGVTYAGMPDGAGALVLNRDGLNNGHLTTTDSANSSTSGTYIAPGGFDQAGNTTAFVTFDLNTTLNPLGYNIASIQSFMGLSINGVAAAQANQTYTVAVSLVGSASYTDIATVNFTPFGNVNSYHESYVNITNSTGVLASGVDSIRFTFLKPTIGSGSYDGTVIRELDVIGSVVPVPEPSVALLGGLGVLAMLHRRRD